MPASEPILRPQASCADTAAVLELTQELIRRPSVTPEDAGCLELIAERLAARGFRIERMDAAGVSNLWARLGTEPPLLCFAGHTDVVPTGPRERWSSDPFEPTVTDGWLLGRGAADMKSSLAAFVVAIERFLDRQAAPRGSIALLLTSDEEGVATHGSCHVVEQLRVRGERIDYCLVGEPSSEASLGDVIKNGRRGSLSGELRVHGLQGHIAYPQLARNPIHQFAPALAELASEVWDRGNAHFPPTTWQVSNLRAGTGATNVVPGELVAQFNFRFSTASAPETLQARVHQILDRHGLDYTLDWVLSARPYLTQGRTLLAALSGAIAAELGIKTSASTVGGTSDGRFIAEICPEVVEFGPCNATIHQLNERIAVNDLGPLARVYRHVLERLGGA